MARRTTVLALAGILLAAGCGGGRAATPAADHNATDVMFLQMMVAREQETAELLQVARARTLPTAIRTLAEAIRTTQADESRTMQGWLTGWRQPVRMDPAAASHRHHGGLAVLGPDDLADLKRADSDAFSTQFVNLLIAQQHDAVELARMETATGTHAGAEELARRIVKSRTAQIATLLTAATHLTP